MSTCTQSLFMFGRSVSDIAGIDKDDEDDSVSNEQLLSSEPMSSLMHI